MFSTVFGFHVVTWDIQHCSELRQVHSRAVWSVNIFVFRQYFVLIVVGDPSSNPGKGWRTKLTPYCLCMLMAEDHAKTNVRTKIQCTQSTITQVMKVGRG